MKKLFLFALLAALCCSCTESNTDENTDPNGGSNSGQTTPPDPDSDAKDVIHVPEGGMLAGILNELGLKEPLSLKLSGTLNIFDFMTIRTTPSLEHLDISRVNLSVLPEQVFSGCTNIKSLILPNTLTAIKSYALSKTLLVSISIPASVETIEEYAFEGCEALTSIEIPASVEKIGELAFYGCTSLQTVTFKKGSQLKTIEMSVFGHCKALASIEIPASVETIVGNAFYGCTALASIEIPASVETIGNNAFPYCTALQTVTFEKGSQLKTIGDSTFSGCTSLTSIEIPASVETIGRNVVNGCTSLKTVTFEKGSQLLMVDGYYMDNGAFVGCRALTTVDMSACTQVTEIGGYIFYEDSQLQLFKIGTRTPPSCGYNVFMGINSYSVLKVPAGCVDAYKKATGWNKFTTISELDE